MRNSEEADQVARWDFILHQSKNLAGHRVENKIAHGTPDYAYCLEGVHGWIEFKIHPDRVNLKSNAKLGKWMIDQRRWMMLRHKSKNIFLCVRFKGYDYFLDNKTMFTFEGESLLSLIDNREIPRCKCDLPYKDWPHLQKKAFFSMLLGVKK